jgi:predicted metal-dependent enzyme (double-stranded beta helix superfamily)
MNRVTLERFVDGLTAIRKEEFTLHGVARYLEHNPVEASSLAPYLRYEPTHYTRNLIYKSELFELLAICWDVGQLSRVHNHQGQRCWMAAPIGRLAVQNYRVVREDDKGFCELAEANRLVMDSAHPCYVDPEMPIHSVLNLAEYGQKATSLHVYSLPYDRCLVYSLEQRSYTEVPLFYDSEYGRQNPLTR